MKRNPKGEENAGFPRPSTKTLTFLKYEGIRINNLMDNTNINFQYCFQLGLQNSPNPPSGISEKPGNFWKVFRIFQTYFQVKLSNLQVHARPSKCVQAIGNNNNNTLK